MSEKFDQFVKKQTASMEAGGDQLDVEKEKTLWLEKLNQLYMLVKESLSDYIADGRISLSFSDFALTEELLGTYHVQTALITVGRQVVKLTPVGTLLNSAEV